MPVDNLLHKLLKRPATTPGMATPPRMLLLCGGGTEAFVLMPVTFDVRPLLLPTSRITGRLLW